MKVLKQTQVTAKKHKIPAAIFIVAMVFFGCWAVVNLMPKPLGDRLEYLGKSDYGCWIGFCDSRPGSTYYYGTDMSPEEMKTYFKDADYDPLVNFAVQHARFTTSDGNFIFTYLDINDKQKTSYTTDKTYIISLNGSNYAIAKKHLDN